eukprot:5177403-Pleurochrysis_carterae.AAC.2
MSSRCTPQVLHTVVPRRILPAQTRCGHVAIAPTRRAVRRCDIYARTKQLSLPGQAAARRCNSGPSALITLYANSLRQARFHDGKLCLLGCCALMGA